MVIVVVSALLVLAHTVVAKDFTVGGTQGWGFPPGTQTDYYDTWSSQQTFEAGDKLIFTYSPVQHDVQTVTVSEYSGCTPSQGLKYTTGKDTIALSAPGTYYFYCSIVGHCDQGMKMKVVVKAATAAAPAPLATPPTGSTGSTGSTATALSISHRSIAAAAAVASLIAAFLIQV